MSLRSKAYTQPEYVVGIDEVGRGPLAGPVTLGAVLARRAELPRLKRVFRGAKDSKKLTPEKREEWLKVIKVQAASGALAWKVAHSTSAMIDRKGLTHAIRSALKRALLGTGAKGDTSKVLLDGGLKAPEEFTNQKTIIKGDEKELLISLASIAAKVTRDRIMVRQSKYFPEYGFDVHKGYGTKRHAEAIQKHGLSDLHRVCFCSRFLCHSR